jgi:DNA-binding transcriptional LysR family regulator
MNLSAIRLFMHAMQRGSLAAAARQLNMSPSAASRQLSRLERSIGLKLFRRDRQRLVPTDQADQFYNECYRVLAAVDELPQVARRLAKGAQSRLRLVAMPRIASCLVLPALSRFTTSNPDVEIFLEVMSRREMEKALSSHDFDLGVAVLPLQQVASKVEPLLDVPLVAVLRHGHRLAGRAFLRPTDLLAERVVALSPGSRIRIDAEEAFATEGVEFRPQVTVSTLELAWRLVETADLVTISDPLLALGSEKRTFSLVPLRPSRSNTIGVLSSALASPTETVASFRKELVEQAAQARMEIVELLRERRHVRRRG